MAEQRDVKVFISWSGQLSKDVAVALREWLPLLFDHVKPWASDTDIAPGQRGLNQIESELANTQFGIVVVTAANQHADWLNFEAGALSRTVSEDVENRVVPLLVDLKSATDLTGPLVQFQAKVLDRQGLLLVLQSLGRVAGIEEHVVAQRFEVYWPQLDERLKSALADAAEGKATAPRRAQADVIDEILAHVRALRSEGERGGAPTDRQVESTREFIEQHAKSLGFDLRTFERRADGTLVVVVVPIEQFSVNHARRLEERLRGTFKESPLDFSAIPF